MCPKRKVYLSISETCRRICHLVKEDKDTFFPLWWSFPLLAQPWLNWIKQALLAFLSEDGWNMCSFIFYFWMDEIMLSYSCCQSKCDEKQNISRMERICHFKGQRSKGKLQTLELLETSQISSVCFHLMFLIVFPIMSKSQPKPNKKIRMLRRRRSTDVCYGRGQLLLRTQHRHLPVTLVGFTVNCVICVFFIFWLGL